MVEKIGVALWRLISIKIKSIKICNSQIRKAKNPMFIANENNGP